MDSLAAIIMKSNSGAESGRPSGCAQCRCQLATMVANNVNPIFKPTSSKGDQNRQRANWQKANRHQRKQLRQRHRLQLQSWQELQSDAYDYQQYMRSNFHQVGQVCRPTSRYTRTLATAGAIPPMANARHISSPTSYRASIMKPIVLSLIGALAVLSLLVLAQQSISPSSNQVFGELEGVQANDLARNPSIDKFPHTNLTNVQAEEVEIATPTVATGEPAWYQRVVRPLAGLLGYEDSEGREPGESRPFQRVEQGYLNFWHTNRVYSIIENRDYLLAAATAVPAQEFVASEPAKSSLANSNMNKSNNTATLSLSDQSVVPTASDQAANQINQQLGSLEPISVDKIRGMELPLSKGAQRQSSSAKQTLSPASKPYKLVKCHKSKYDRIIAQKMSMKDLSRPVVESNGRFNNPFPTWNQNSIIDVFKFMVLEQDDSSVPESKSDLDRELPILRPNFRVKESRQGDFRVTWIGHSTLLIQIDGLSILTDPVFSNRAGPMLLLGPKRYREPACEIKSLPRIDIVLISHNHYDHLDASSVKAINDRFGSKCRWIVPLGLGEFMDSMYVDNYVELDWWQKDCYHVGNRPVPRRTVGQAAPNAIRRSIGSSPTRSVSATSEGSQLSGANKTNRIELDIYFTPTQHWSRRGMNDVNKSLWGSYTIVSGNGSTFFFAGDSGYCSAFKEIGKIFGPFSGSAIPIGAYKPRWFLKPAHVNPVEAAQIHRDLRSRKSIAIHHSTFVLSNEHYKEPAKLLASTMENLRVNEGVQEPFVTLKHGESMEFCEACATPEDYSPTAA